VVGTWRSPQTPLYRPGQEWVELHLCVCKHVVGRTWALILSEYSCGVKQINRMCKSNTWKFQIGILRSVIPVVYIRTTVDHWSRNSSQKHNYIVLIIVFHLLSLGISVLLCFIVFLISAWKELVGSLVVVMKLVMNIVVFLTAIPRSVIYCSSRYEFLEAALNKH
jgi:hypothetical protein